VVKRIKGLFMYERYKPIQPTNWNCRISCIDPDESY